MFEVMDRRSLWERIPAMQSDREARRAFFLDLECCLAGDALQLALDGLDRSDLTARELGIVMAAQERLISRAQHQQALDAARLVELQQSEFVPEELCGILRRPIGAVNQLLNLGLGIRGQQLRETGWALEDGRLTYAQAIAISDALSCVPVEVAQAVQERVIPQAEELLPIRLKKATAAAVYELAPDLADDEHEQATTDRTVSRWTITRAMRGLIVEGPTVPVAEILTAIELRAGRTGPDDHRSRAQRSFDALHAICLDSMSDPRRPLRPAQDPHLNITLTLGTALGITRKPGYLPGWGPLAPRAAFDLANTDGARWQAWIVDAATNYLVGMGTKKYRPTRRLRDLNRARHEYSLQPFSAVPSRECDDEHAKPYSHGGTTDPANTGPLNPHAHRAKHEGGWQHTQQADGTRNITSTLGFRYTVRPTAYPVDSDADERARDSA